MVDSLLGGLFGGPDGDRVRAKAQDFTSRYDKGAPEEGYSNDEVLDQFKTAFGQLNPEQQREAAEQAMQRMSPDQRKEYRRAMRQQRGANRHFSQDDHDDPRVAAQETQSFMKDASDNQEGGLGGLLGNLFGTGGSPEPQPRAQTPAQAAPAAENSNMLDNPAVKAAMAGMAAFAFKKIMDQHQQR